MRKRKIGPTDRKHVAKIDAFIPEAEKNARRVITNDEFVNGASSGAGAVSDSYSREFHAAMDRLTVAAGLRVA